MSKINTPNKKRGGNIKWSDDLILEKLTPIVDKLERMPSKSELRNMGETKLAEAIIRYGGIEEWARQLNVETKRSQTSIGRKIELKVAKDLMRRGFDVEKQSHRAPFDLLVDEYRIDVKSSHLHEYKNPMWYQHVYDFSLGRKKEHTCDFYILCCLDDEDSIVKTYIVPASVAGFGHIKFPPGKRYSGRYRKYKDAYHLLLEE